MQGASDAIPRNATESSRRAFAFAQRLLTTPGDLSQPLAGLLAELAGLFDAPGAGLASLPEGVVLARGRDAGKGEAAWPTAWPWQQEPELLAKVRSAPAALALPMEGGSLLATALTSNGGSGWLLWLEDEGPR